MLKLENVTKIFKNGKGIKDVSFEVPQNSVCGFLGDNGMGKTTTIKSIFQQYLTSDGLITYKGESLKNRDTLLKFGLFPDSGAIPIEYKYEDYVKFLALLYRVPKKTALKKLKELNEIFSLEGYEKKSLSALSAGMLKRAMLVTIMIIDPEVVILDEPTANLDVESRKEFIEILRFLKEKGKTIIITSHIVEELQTIIDYLVFIDNGEIKYSSSFDNSKEKIADIYEKHKTKSTKNRLEELRNYEK
ncbi:ABC transporter ATP-binding protein [Spiroplasma alleghenense]|uniref:ABC transporter ATP-binding protein n=1 Tax=Spiroplasma alleghenense TaxID=216931 RepID=A0A345Z530_9MOLU|nr:ABC transporter ATP-binding protein [Spiroplasma alleghenense]AXK51709.1 ABC transporter ATP-binding protein [Spiroplasma alleghenense]